MPRPGGRINCLSMTTTRMITAAAQATTAALQLDYLPPDQLAAQPASWWQNVLGVVGFGEPPRIDEGRVPVTASMTPPLRSADDLCEVWRVTGRPVQLSNGAARQSRVHYRYCEELLFGCITLDERQFKLGAAVRGGIDPAGVDAGALSRATEIAYQEIFAVLSRTEH